MFRCLYYKKKTLAMYETFDDFMNFLLLFKTFSKRNIWKGELSLFTNVLRHPVCMCTFLNLRFRCLHAYIFPTNQIISGKVRTELNRVNCSFHTTAFRLSHQSDYLFAQNHSRCVFPEALFQTLKSHTDIILGIIGVSSLKAFPKLHIGQNQQQLHAFFICEGQR